MATIFDREFRKEKTLDVSKRLGGPKKEAKKEDGAHEVVDLEQVIAELESNFFNNVAEDEEERDMIRNRGRAAMEAAQDDGEDLDNFDKAIQEVVEVIWTTYDKDGSGSLDKEESFAFVKDAIGQLGGAVNEEGFNEAFGAIDVDGSGQLTKAEMARFIQKMM
jgi:Ca2+-binding EF-hand superfamily protein